MDQARLAAAARDAAAIAPNLALLRKEQADLAAQVGALQDVYGADYPDLRSTKAQLAAITAQINAETGRAQERPAPMSRPTRPKSPLCKKTLAATRAQSQTEDAASGPVRALEQRAEAGQAMLRSIALQADQLAQDVSLTRPDARILSAAATPTTPSTPNRLVILAASLVLGLCSGLLLAGLADTLDTSFRSGIDVREQLGLSCLALVPEVPRPQQAGLASPFSLFAEQLRALTDRTASRGGDTLHRHHRGAAGGGENHADHRLRPRARRFRAARAGDRRRYPPAGFRPGVQCRRRAGIDRPSCRAGRAQGCAGAGPVEPADGVARRDPGQGCACRCFCPRPWTRS